MGLFEILAKSPAKQAGEYILSQLPLAIQDKLRAAQTAQELGGEGSLLFDAPTMAEKSAAVKPSAARKKEYADENLGNSLMAMPGAGATRYVKNLIKAGEAPTMAKAKDSILKKIVDNPGHILSWQYRDRANYIKAVRDRYKEMMGKYGVVDPYVKESLTKLKENLKTGTITPENVRNLMAPPDKSPYFNIKGNVVNLPDAKRKGSNLFINPTDQAAEFTRQEVKRAVSNPSGLQKEELDFLADFYKDHAEASKENALNFTKNKTWLKDYFKGNPLFDISNKQQAAATAKMISDETKALSKILRDKEKYRSMVRGFEFVRPDQAKAEIKYMDKYAKEKAEKIKNFEKNFKYEPLPTDQDLPYFKTPSDSIARPASSESDVASMIDKAAKDAKAWKKVEEARLLKEASENYAMNHGGSPIPEPKQPTYMEEQLKEFSQIPSTEELAKADRARRAAEIDAAAKAPASSMENAGTLLPKNQRKGYQGWTKAKGGMNINVKKRGP